MPTGLLLLLLVGSLEVWTFWRLGINLWHAFEHHERAAFLPASGFPSDPPKN